ncbi:MAG: hypothetical protein H7301_12970 [Cryobacterium sp.]|nr:hypothetical protein [Oligoflexia bacterium]
MTILSRVVVGFAVATVFVGSAFSVEPAAIKKPGNGQYFRWAAGYPGIITRTKGCSSPLLCIGTYEVYVEGYNGPAVIKTGQAFCNAVYENKCPTAQTCAEDEAITHQKAAYVGDPRGDVNMPDMYQRGSKRESGDAN